jgi:hypothetical protein
VEPFAIYGGVPAKKIGQRFDDEIIRQLMEIRWWDRGVDWIKVRAPLFRDIHQFLAACGPQGRPDGLNSEEAT